MNCLLARLLAISLCLTAWAVHDRIPAHAQAIDPNAEPTATPDGTATQPNPPDKATEALEVGPSASGIATATGLRRYVPGAWGQVAVNLNNPTSQPVELLATSYLAGDKGLQYGRRIWVPPHARRACWYPIRVPRVADRQQTYVEIGSLLQDAQQPATSAEVLLEKPTSRLSLDQSHVVTGVLADEKFEPDQTNWTYEAILAARTSQQQSRQLAIMEVRSLPPTAEALEGMDQLVLASSQLGAHAATLRAVRTWLFRGGRMWVMLDRVDSDTLSRLLGDDMPIEVVDRVGLTTLEMTSTNPSPLEKPDILELEEPVEMVRVLLSGGRVTHSVDGWPAAFWLNVGQGKVLVTTVGPRAWIRVRRDSDPRPRSILHATDYAPKEPLYTLSGELFSPWTIGAAEQLQVLPYLSERIGYRTLPRGVLVGVLGGFCLLVVGAAITLARRGHAERLAPVVAGGALLAVAVIVGLGWATRSAVPSSMASFQLVRTLPDASEVDLQGTLGLYNPESLQEPLEVPRGGVIWPDLTGLEGTTRRVVFTDMDRYHWENLRLPPGVRTASLQMTASLSSPLLARASFDDSGLVGSLATEDFRDVSDAVIATRSGRLVAARLQADGTFAAAANGVLDRGQFTDRAILNDEQRRRMEILSQFLEPDRVDRLIDGPALLAWAAARPVPWQLPEGVQQSGTSLLVLPLQFETPAPGSSIVVPSPLATMLSVMGPQGQSLSSSYNNLTRQWLGQSVPSEMHLRFFVPEVLRGMQVQRATLRLEVNCPSRRLEVLGFEGSAPTVLQTYQNPIGVVSVRITDPRVLQLGSDGGLLLGLYVDRGVMTENETEWRIEDAQLEVAGRMPGP